MKTLVDDKPHSLTPPEKLVEQYQTDHDYKPMIIFIAAHKDFAIKSYELHA